MQIGLGERREGEEEEEGVRERMLKPQNMHYVYIFSCREVGAVASLVAAATLCEIAQLRTQCRAVSGHFTHLVLTLKWILEYSDAARLGCPSATDIGLLPTPLKLYLPPNFLPKQLSRAPPQPRIQPI